MINQGYQFTKYESSRGMVYGPMPDGQLHAKISHTIIRRINFPRHLCSAKAISRKASLNAKARPMLSEQEEMDIAQTVGFVLVATGAMERQTLTRGDWKELFRAVRGADCLRIDRKAKNHSEIVSIDTMTDEALAVISARLGVAPHALASVKRKIMARKIRYERACIIAQFRADTSRKRKAGVLGARRFLRFIVQYYIHGTGKGLTDLINANHDQLDTLNAASLAYRKYVKNGDAILTGEAMAGISPREYKSFADLRWGAGLLAS